MDKFFQGYMSLQLSTRGSVNLQYDDRKYSLKGIWVWAHFPGPRIKLCPSEPSTTWDHRYIAFSGPLVAQWQGEGLFPFQAPQRMPSSGRDYIGLFDELLYRVKRPAGWGHWRAVNLLERLLLELAQARRENSTQLPWLRKVFEAIAENREFSPDYAAIAHAAGMTLRTLRGRFRQATGVPIHAYVLQSRMAKARLLLGETDHPIKDIAERLGYEDIFFFTKQFKKHTGITPAVYRKSRFG
ncbi:MAG: hypothetical protein A2293_03180 [Elusimicrobia bacterium RIFOXYB2_FULL_49_7]|nr:MAG: hypothetical protein A2293_03180 [Elusimicrobia bacterium RIFOXYB2_FULL_49_7]